ncbi:efflux RND transporter periplasmic adaptor subunit [Rhodocyclus tenuis]|uniref:efflux RND transporter periplasmic adaptor subunit n=1 Tax=Rhodocyclus tenuis TaxID=1066 RepID=UPI0019053EDB|nr:efflux RND transporter periplasmic adaptor subunit [Rhodocyclus tenuis]
MNTAAFPPTSIRSLQFAPAAGSSRAQAASPRRLHRLLLGMLLATIFGGSLPAARAAEAGSPPPLATLVVATHAVGVSLPAEATVEAVRQATLAAQVSGRVVDMRVDAGQVVKKGDLLLRIDAREAAQAASSASAQLANARASYARSENLRQRNFVSQAALDRARADLAAAEAAAGQAGVVVGHAAVTAPISGIVARRLIEAGEMASPGTPLLLIYDPQGLRMTASVPQRLLPQLKAARGAQIEFPELGRTIDAPSFIVLPTADASTHVSEVRINLPDDLRNVIPGMAARVRFVLGNERRLTIPASALVRRGEVAAVYVQSGEGADSRLALRQLRLGETLADGSIEVLAGLRDGEVVAVDAVKAAIALKATAKSSAPAGR